MSDYYKVELKPLVAILRRIQKSKYPTLLLSNRMIMQCYSIDEDSDIGLHYILHVPDTDEYVSEFWDSTLILEPKMILSAYTAGHKELLEVKKEKKLKPKEVSEEALFKITDTGARLKFMYYASDEVISTQSVEFDYPVNEHGSVVENITKTYWDMISRVKQGGLGVAFDAQRYNLYMLGTSSSQVRYFKIKIGGHRIMIPLYKSMFVGKKEWDEFYISLQETTIPSVYLYAIQYTWGGVTDQYVGYLLSF